MLQFPVTAEATSVCKNPSVREQATITFEDGDGKCRTSDELSSSTETRSVHQPITGRYWSGSSLHLQFQSEPVGKWPEKRPETRWSQHCDWPLFAFTQQK